MLDDLVYAELKFLMILLSMNCDLVVLGIAREIHSGKRNTAYKKVIKIGSPLLILPLLHSQCDILARAAAERIRCGTLNSRAIMKGSVLPPKLCFLDVATVLKVSRWFGIGENIWSFSLAYSMGEKGIIF